MISNYLREVNVALQALADHLADRDLVVNLATDADEAARHRSDLYQVIENARNVAAKLDQISDIASRIDRIADPVILTTID